MLSQVEDWVPTDVQLISPTGSRTVSYRTESSVTLRTSTVVFTRVQGRRVGTLPCLSVHGTLERRDRGRDSWCSKRERLTDPNSDWWGVGTGR